MSGGFRIRTIMASAVVLLSAASSAVLAAPGASASAGRLTMSVHINSQVVAGSACNWTVNFNVTITSIGFGPVTVTGVNAGSYAPLDHDGGLAAGAVLSAGTSTFTNLSSGNGPAEGQPCPAEAPAPLVLTVNTSAGSVTWNQSVSDPRVVTMPALPQDTSATLAGSFDVANCSKYYFEYGTTTAYGHQVGTSTAHCPNDGTTTQIVSFTATNLEPGTVYHYRLVVVQSYGTKLYGQDVQFMTGSTQVPVGTVGMIGLAALAGGVLFITQRRRRNRQHA